MTPPIDGQTDLRRALHALQVELDRATSVNVLCISGQLSLRAGQWP
jgi:hypothetical protein